VGSVNEFEDEEFVEGFVEGIAVEVVLEVFENGESVHDISWPFEQDNRWKGYEAER